jgi:hypothetical protein
MFESLFNLPLAVAGTVIIGTLCAFAGIGVTLVRRRVLPKLRIKEEDSGFTGSMMQGVLVFYGLAVALMAVSVWQTYSDVSKIVSGEATSLASLYRDVSGYPEPLRPKLQASLRDYIQQIIREAWPLQQRGVIPTAGVDYMNYFQGLLIGFEPATEGQKLLHAETLGAYNQLILARRLRVDTVGTGLPSLMWTVIVAGAFISLTSSFFYKVEDARLQMLQVQLLAVFIGLVIFMIFALDHPYRGDLGIPSDPYQLIYDQLMKPKG